MGHAEHGKFRAQAGRNGAGEDQTTKALVKDQVARSLHSRGAGGSCEPVRTPILIHNDTTGGIEPASVVQQAMKNLVAVRNGRPANPEGVANAGLPLVRRFRDGS